MSNRLVVKASSLVDGGQIYHSSLFEQEFFILIGF
jgi:hypothetical protein